MSGERIVAQGIFPLTLNYYGQMSCWNAQKFRHAGGSRHPEPLAEDRSDVSWIPAFAGMTFWVAGTAPR